MRRLILVSMAVGLIGFGCSQKAAVQSEAPMQKPAPTVVESKPVVAQKPAESAPQENLNEKELAEIKQLQARLKDIHFNFDKADLEATAKAELTDLANILAKHPKLKVMIEGNCDERGTREYNLALGDKRANAAKQYLIAAGIPSARIDTISYGKEKPLCTESTEECWAKNRRDHFVLN
ncbi:MAG: peptidoglycan-associated lipoprotein Pal [Dissulfurispiraceae bacterium]